MSQRLTASAQADLVNLIKNALGDGETDVQMGPDSVFVSVLVERAVFGEVRVEFQDFEEGHWEVYQSVALWNHRVSSHGVEKIARLLLDVGARVREAEAQATMFMRRVVGTRVSAEFSPIVL